VAGAVERVGMLRLRCKSLCSLAAPLSMTAHDDFFLISSATYWNDWGCGKQIQVPVCKLLNPDNLAAKYCILRS